MPDPGADIPLPPHAYVPGQNGRHAEGWFDAIKASVTPETPPDLLHHTRAWRAGLAYLKAGYYWECHEVLEAVWMQTPSPSPEREMAQAIIQLANAQLKLNMGKPNAARRLAGMVRAHLARCPADRPTLGLQVSWVDMQVNALGSNIVGYDAL